VVHDSSNVAVIIAIFSLANTCIAWVIVRAVRRYDRVVTRVEELEKRDARTASKFSKLEGLFGISIRVDD
jgi:hypothetical protein